MTPYAAIVRDEFERFDSRERPPALALYGLIWTRTSRLRRWNVLKVDTVSRNISRQREVGPVADSEQHFVNVCLCGNEMKWCHDINYVVSSVQASLTRSEDMTHNHPK